MKSTQAAKDMVELDLLRRSAKGDQESFQKLYSLTCRLVHRYLTRVLYVNQAVDSALADTYLEVWKNAQNYKGTMKVSTWLIGIARHIALRKLSQPAAKKNIENQLLSDINKIEDEALHRQRILHQAIHSLPLNHREILGLALLPNFTYQDIAKLLKVPPEKAAEKVFQAKTAYKNQLQALGENQ